MPPRYAYWTILIDGAATAFRAKDREELVPTLTQLRRTNENVELKTLIAQPVSVDAVRRS